MDLLADKTLVGVIWVYKMKVNEKCMIEKYKARMVSKGFVQQPGIDYGETFSPASRLDIVRIVLYVVVEHKWLVYQMDVKSPFLNDILEEELYVNNVSFSTGLMFFYN